MEKRTFLSCDTFISPPLPNQKVAENSKVNSRPLHIPRFALPHRLSPSHIWCPVLEKQTPFFEISASARCILYRRESHPPSPSYFGNPRKHLFGCFGGRLRKIHALPFLLLLVKHHHSWAKRKRRCVARWITYINQLYNKTVVIFFLKNLTTMRNFFESYSIRLQNQIFLRSES